MRARNSAWRVSASRGSNRRLCWLTADFVDYGARGLPVFKPSTTAEQSRITQLRVALDNNLRAVVQRVSRAQVSVGKEVVGKIGPGLKVLVGVAKSDTRADAADRFTS